MSTEKALNLLRVADACRQNGREDQAYRAECIAIGWFEQAFIKGEQDRSDQRIIDGNPARRAAERLH